ncbi:hypothetical protein V1478_004269 [Vespula squamosa]|uniref:Uncharacterized protein n=1 Tax=Vespula squamosa TaxID=30214 RepID=A0ABD2BHH0_VESSQ
MSRNQIRSNLSIIVGPSAAAKIMGFIHYSKILRETPSITWWKRIWSSCSSTIRLDLQLSSKSSNSSAVDWKYFEDEDP